MSDINVDLELDTGGTINIAGSNLTADDVTRLQTAVDSLNPVNLEDIKTQLGG